MTDKLPKATHTGTLNIGDLSIPCAVLDDGTRVLREHGITTALGSRSGASKRIKRDAKMGGAPLPIFVAPSQLEPFISAELRAGLLEPIRYMDRSRIVEGFPADLLPDVCNVWLNAREEGALQSQQMARARKAEILTRGLATVGIIGLVDEATGYQDVRARRALEVILDKFIAKELRKWAKTFPDEFYREIFRLKGWPFEPWSVKRPAVIGRYTNDMVYERLAPGVLDELRRKNPVTPKGHRKARHHQWLTEDIGHPRLREHIAAVIALMRASTSWTQFHRMLQRAFPRYGTNLELPFVDEDQTQNP